MAKLAALAGALLHVRAGEAGLGSEQEYCVGIIEPSAYAEVESLNLGVAQRLVAARPSWQLPPRAVPPEL